MERFDPLKNLRTSMVFLELLDGPRTATGISATLNITPQSVFEHIVRLKRIDIVKLGQRHGKFQEYEINSSRFYELFLQKAPRSVDRKIIMRGRLVDNKSFRVLVEKYLKEVRDLKNVTLWQAINEFEQGLIRIFPALKDRSSFKEEETLALLETLEEWYNKARHSYTIVQAALLRAFENLNLTYEQ